MAIIVKNAQLLPQKEALLRVDELVSNCPEAAYYFAERYKKIIKSIKKHPPECEEVLKIIEDRAFRTHYLHFPNQQSWFGKLPDLSFNEFTRMQRNIGTNESKQLHDRGLPPGLRSNYDINANGHVGPTYFTADNKPLGGADKENEPSFDALFNAYLSEKGLVTDENSTVQKATQDGRIERPLEAQEIDALRAEIPGEFEEYLREKDIYMNVETSNSEPIKQPVIESTKSLTEEAQQKQAEPSQQRGQK